MVDENTCARGLEAQNHLLTRIDEGQRAAAECTRRRVEVDVVRKRVRARID